MAGVAFLWFIGVLRDRLGQQEDRFFATVFFGSALLFLAMLFAAAAVTGAVTLLASSSKPGELIDTATFHFARAVAYIILNVYGIKMGAVFMFSTSTVVIYTGITPRWIAYVGYLLALAVLIGSYYVNWSFAVLPVWVLLVSAYILTDNLRRYLSLHADVARQSPQRRTPRVHSRSALTLRPTREINVKMVDINTAVRCEVLRRDDCHRTATPPSSG